MDSIYNALSEQVHSTSISGKQCTRGKVRDQES